jgi:hypothetical protein
VFEDALDNATAVRVARERHCVFLDGGDNKLNRVWVCAADLDALLNRVVCVLRMDALDDVTIKLFDELLTGDGFDDLEGLLDDAATVHMERKGEHVTLEFRGECGDGGGAAVLENLLQKVVGENVDDEAVGVGQDADEDFVDFRVGRYLEALLDEARAVLVSRKLDNVVHDICELPVAGGAADGQ